MYHRGIKQIIFIINRLNSILSRRFRALQISCRKNLAHLFLAIWITDGDSQSDETRFIFLVYNPSNTFCISLLPIIYIIIFYKIILQIKNMKNLENKQYIIENNI